MSIHRRPICPRQLGAAKALAVTINCCLQKSLIYQIISAVNVETRSTELSHITEWAKRNNLIIWQKVTKLFLLTVNENKKYLNQLKFLYFRELRL